ncbi:MAG: GHKL domain-containing protein [Christensenellales bacterium]
MPVHKKGIGLSNIEAVAEKYSGAVTTQLQGGCFFLNVLLVISRSLDDISGNPH